MQGGFALSGNVQFLMQIEIGNRMRADFEREKICIVDVLLRDLPEDVRRDCRSGCDIGFIREPFAQLEI